MKKVFILVLFILLLSALTLPAQDNAKRFRLGFEFGADVYYGDMVKPEQVRENKSAYPGYNGYDESLGDIGANQAMTALYLGVKPEFFFLRNQIGIATGIRFSRFLTAFSSDKDYFLWQLKEEGVYTDYLRIRNIEQQSYYIGIPLEIRFFPNRRELPFQHYFKLGAAFNYRLRTNNDIRFQDNAMNRHTGEIENKIGNPDDFTSYIYPVFGFKIGKGKFPRFNIEAHFPGFLVNPNAFSFVKTYAGFGIQLSVQI
jgi:hypothetical protein